MGMSVVNQCTLAIGSPIYAANETVISASQQAQIETLQNEGKTVSVLIDEEGVFLITTILGITGLWIAVLADTGATVLVTLNALRLLRFKS